MRQFLALGRSSGGRSIGGSMAVLVLTLATGVLTARMLTVPERGTVATLTVFGAMIAQAANAGPAEAQLLARARGVGNGVATAVSWSISGVITLPVAVVAVAYAHQITDVNGGLTATLVFLAVMSTVGLMSNYLLLAQQQYGKSAALRAVPAATQVAILLAILAWATPTVANVMLAILAAGAIATLASVSMSRPWRQRGGDFRTQGRITLRFVFTTGGSHALRIFGYRVDLILVGLIAGAYASGIYSVSIALTAAAISVTANLTPILMTKTGQESSEYSQLSALVSVLLAVGISCAGPWLIPRVYGAEYSPGFPLMLLLSAAMVGAFALETCIRLLQKTSYEAPALVISGCVMILQIAFISIGTATLGAEGAALGSVAAYASGVIGTLGFAASKGFAKVVATHLSVRSGIQVLAGRLRQS